MMDKSYGYLPLNEEKPCMYVVSLFEDYSKRLYSTNLLSRLTEKLVNIAFARNYYYCKLIKSFVHNF